MKFDDFKKEISEKLDTVHLSDIAKELDVSPQVVNNWKKRNQVPYKYVKIMKAIVHKINKQKHVNKNEDLIEILKTVTKREDLKEKPLTEDLKTLSVYLIKFLKTNYKSIILTSIFFPFVTAIYVLYFAPIIFDSKVVIIPLSNSGQNSGLQGIASQFGVNLGNKSSNSEIGSVNLIPDLIRSRSLHNSLLKREFKIDGFKDKISLLNFFFGKNEDYNYNEEIYLEKGSNLIAKSINISKNKINDLITIKVSADKLTLQLRWQMLLLKS